MTDGSGKNHMEYDCSNADRLGDDAWIGAVFFRLYEKIACSNIKITSNVNGAEAPSREEFYNV